MIVSRHSFDEVVAKLSCPGQYGLDSETTGLELSDRLFSIILADDSQGYYFNFNAGLDHLGGSAPDELTLPRAWVLKLAPILEETSSLFFLHNAKFDLTMLSKEGLEVLGSVHCTQGTERLIRNNYLGGKPYSLDACAKRRGLAKDSSVDAYIKKHKLTSKVRIPGKDKAIERKHFDKVPFDVIVPYAEQDAVLARVIGLDQLKEIQKIDHTAPATAPPLQQVLANEYKLTKTCYRMEREGIRIDRPYVERALAATQKSVEIFKKDFAKLTGIEYENSPTTIKEAFKRAGIDLPLTQKGNICTNKEVLDALENPIADKIREIRGAEKLASTYYSSFLYFADHADMVHANIRQGGTETGRFSYSDPNLQNLPKEDEPEDKDKPFIVRKSFVPLNEDFCFVPIDFKQQEFRMMLDYAGERELIDAVMAGADVHEATAELVGTTRKYAKTINFGLLYGMGAPKLARALKISLSEAYELRARYFAKLPKVQRFIRTVMNTGESRGYIWNWFGFRNHISSPEYAYILPNHLIQGGCAQVIRVAMPRIEEHIRSNKLRSTMLAQVHDELLFQVHRSEVHHVPEFQKIMEDVYKPRNGLYLHCSVEHSLKSWGKWDQRKGYPDALSVPA